jgi:hypothetical protein
MRNFSRVSVVVVAAAAILTGCVNADPIVTPAPIPSATPLFATEADALAAATAAYAAYVTLSDKVFSEGGSGAERLSEVSTGRQLEANVAGFAEAKSLGYRSLGTTSFDTVSVQKFDRESGGSEAMIVVYLCEDVSKVDVVNGKGESVVSPDRPDRAGYEVTFAAAPSSLNNLLVASKDLWPTLAC